MALASLAVRLAIAAAAVSLIGLAAFAAVDERAPAAIPVMVDGPAGDPLEVPSRPGVTQATWQWQPVIVFVANASVLEGVETYRGEGEATESVALPGGLRLFVLSAKSTHLGCTVGFRPAMGSSREVADYDGDGQVDGRLMDPCHMGMWDPYHKGTPLGGFAPERLASLRIQLRDGHVLGTGFDGPTGPAHDR